MFLGHYNLGTESNTRQAELRCDDLALPPPPPDAGAVAGKAGTRPVADPKLQVKALFENIEGGATVAQFVEWFPGVTRAQVEAVLEHAQRSLEAV